MRKQHRSEIHTVLSVAILCAVLLGGCNIPTSTSTETETAAQAPTSFQELVPTEVSKPATAATKMPTPFVRDEPLATPVGKIIDPTEIPLPVPEAQTTPVESIFGASVTPLEESGGLNQMVEAGLFWTRVDMDWKQVEPTQGAREWANNAPLEEKIANAAQAGMKVILILGGTPDWALKPGYPCGPVASQYFDAFASFAREAVERYSQPPYNVRYWEIFNEPDAPRFLGCWGEPADKDYYGGGYYGEMMKVVYPAMKSGNPDAQVLVGGLLMGCDPINPPDLSGKPGVKADCTEGKFFEGILAAGAVNAFDGVAFHSYDYYGGYGDYGNPNWNSSRQTTGSAVFVKAAYLRSLMEKYGVKDRYLVNTEFALVCGRDGETVCDPFIEKVEATKAYYAVQLMATSMAEAYRAAIWYAVFYGRNNALLNKDFSPKPVFHAMEFTDKMIGQASFIQTFRDQNFVVQEFQRGGQKIWVVWTRDNQLHTFGLPSIPASVFVIGPDGKAHEEAPSQQLSLDVEPAFLVFQNP